MPTDFVSGTATTRANGFAFLGVRPTTAPADRPVAPAVAPRFSFLGTKPSQFPQARTIQGAHSEARLAQPYLVARAPLVPVHGNILPGRPTFLTKPLAAPSSRVVLPKRIYEPSPSACASSGPHRQGSRARDLQRARDSPIHPSRIRPSPRSRHGAVGLGTSEIGTAG